jgi:hypothetical protein
MPTAREVTSFIIKSFRAGQAEMFERNRGLAIALPAAGTASILLGVVHAAPMLACAGGGLLLLDAGVAVLVGSGRRPGPPGGSSPSAGPAPR